MLRNGYLILPQSLIILWLIVILLYRYFYNRNANAVLNGAKGMKLIPPWKFSLISLISVLLIYNAAMFAQIRKTERKQIYDANDFFSISYSADSMEKLDETAYQGLYSHFDNAAYTKKDYIRGDFQYTVFTSQLFSDGMHPDALVYIQYTGEDLNPATMFTTCTFKDPEGNLLSSFMKGNNPHTCFMFMLRYGEDCTAEITLDYLKDKEDADKVTAQKTQDERQEFLKETALIHDTFTLDLKQHH